MHTTFSASAGSDRTLLDTYGSASPTLGSPVVCDRPCAGSPGEICGGHLASSVYALRVPDCANAPTLWGVGVAEVAGSRTATSVGIACTTGYAPVSSTYVGCYGEAQALYCRVTFCTAHVQYLALWWCPGGS